MRRTQEERLYRMAVERAWAPFGRGGLMALGTTLRRALILAEVAQIIAGQADEAAGPAMIRFARYAAVAVTEEQED
jgi:hypothetical protein